MSGFSSSASSQSTPSWLVSRPSLRARARPSLSGSMPIIQRGSSHSERNNLYSRSVLMFPDPTIATEALSGMRAPRYSKLRLTAPRPSKSATNLSPGLASNALVHDPGSTMSPALRRTPKLSTLRASQATAVTGLPSTASLRPLATTSPLRVSTASMLQMSMSFGDTRAAPSTQPADDALSAMVSHNWIFQSLIRVSISSIAGAKAAVAASTSSSVQPSPGRSSANTNPTSTSTRGYRYLPAGTGRSSNTAISSSRWP